MSLSIEAVELRAGPRAAIQLVLDSLARLRTSGDIALAIVKPGSDTIQTLSNICDLHLCLEEVNGCLLVYGKRPPTSLFAVTYDYSHGYPLVGLIPML